MAAKVQFLFDYASPWAYLVSEIIDVELSGITVDYRPVYLRGLEAFQDKMPYGPNKLRYITQDLARCLERHALSSKPPARFPINGIYAVRGALVAQELGCFDVYHPAVMRGAWAESRDISEPEPLLDLIDAAGLDATAFRERMSAPTSRRRFASPPSEPLHSARSAFRPSSWGKRFSGVMTDSTTCGRQSMPWDERDRVVTHVSSRTATRRST